MRESLESLNYLQKFLSEINNDNYLQAVAFGGLYLDVLEKEVPKKTTDEVKVKIQEELTQLISIQKFTVGHVNKFVQFKNHLPTGLPESSIGLIAGLAEMLSKAHGIDIKKIGTSPENSRDNQLEEVYDPQHGFAFSDIIRNEEEYRKRLRQGAEKTASHFDKMLFEECKVTNSELVAEILPDEARVFRQLYPEVSQLLDNIEESGTAKQKEFIPIANDTLQRVFQLSKNDNPPYHDLNETLGVIKKYLENPDSNLVKILLIVNKLLNSSHARMKYLEAFLHHIELGNYHAAIIYGCLHIDGIEQLLKYTNKPLETDEIGAILAEDFSELQISKAHLKKFEELSFENKSKTLPLHADNLILHLLTGLTAALSESVGQLKDTSVYLNDGQKPTAEPKIFSFEEMIKNQEERDRMLRLGAAENGSSLTLILFEEYQLAHPEEAKKLQLDVARRKVTEQIKALQEVLADERYDSDLRQSAKDIIEQMHQIDISKTEDLYILDNLLRILTNATNAVLDPLNNNYSSKYEVDEYHPINTVIAAFNLALTKLKFKGHKQKFLQTINKLDKDSIIYRLALKIFTEVNNLDLNELNNQDVLNGLIELLVKTEKAIGNPLNENIIAGSFAVYKKRNKARDGQALNNAIRDFNVELFKNKIKADKEKIRSISAAVSAAKTLYEKIEIAEGESTSLLALSRLQEIVSSLVTMSTDDVAPQQLRRILNAHKKFRDAEPTHALIEVIDSFDLEILKLKIRIAIGSLNGLVTNGDGTDSDYLKLSAKSISDKIATAIDAEQDVFVLIEFLEILIGTLNILRTPDNEQNIRENLNSNAKRREENPTHFLSEELKRFDCEVVKSRIDNQVRALQIVIASPRTNKLMAVSAENVLELVIEKREHQTDVSELNVLSDILRQTINAMDPFNDDAFVKNFEANQRRYSDRSGDTLNQALYDYFEAATTVRSGVYAEMHAHNFTRAKFHLIHILTSDTNIPVAARKIAFKILQNISMLADQGDPNFPQLTADLNTVRELIEARNNELFLEAFGKKNSIRLTYDIKNLVGALDAECYLFALYKILAFKQAYNFQFEIYISNLLEAIKKNNSVETFQHAARICLLLETFPRKLDGADGIDDVIYSYVSKAALSSQDVKVIAENFLTFYVNIPAAGPYACLLHKFYLPIIEGLSDKADTKSIESTIKPVNAIADKLTEDLKLLDISALVPTLEELEHRLAEGSQEDRSSLFNNFLFKELEDKNNEKAKEIKTRVHRDKLDKAIKELLCVVNQSQDNDLKTLVDNLILAIKNLKGLSADQMRFLIQLLQKILKQCQGEDGEACFNGENMRLINGAREVPGGQTPIVDKSFFNLFVHLVPRHRDYLINRGIYADKENALRGLFDDARYSELRTPVNNLIEILSSDVSKLNLNIIALSEILADTEQLIRNPDVSKQQFRTKYSDKLSKGSRANKDNLLDNALFQIFKIAAPKSAEQIKQQGIDDDFISARGRLERLAKDTKNANLKARGNQILRDIDLALIKPKTNKSDLTRFLINATNLISDPGNQAYQVACKDDAQKAPGKSSKTKFRRGLGMTVVGVVLAVGGGIAAPFTGGLSLFATLAGVAFVVKGSSDAGKHSHDRGLCKALNDLVETADRETKPSKRPSEHPVLQSPEVTSYVEHAIKTAEVIKNTAIAENDELNCTTRPDLNITIK